MHGMNQKHQNTPLDITACSSGQEEYKVHSRMDYNLPASIAGKENQF